MATDDVSTLSAIFKTIYPDNVIKDEVYANNPLFGLMPKMEKFDGSASQEPLIYARSQNRSAGFANANLFQTYDLTAAFLLTRAKNYGMGSLSNEAMKASRSDKGAFMSVLKVAAEGALKSLTRSICTSMYRTGTGSIAQISSTATINSSSTQVALSNAGDIVNFELGMDLAFSATDGGSLRAYASSYAYVVNIDRQNGTFLCAATFQGSAAALSSLITSVAVGDYIYANPGDLNSMMVGTAGWIVGSSVSATPFFNVVRTADTVRLAGTLYNATAMAIDEGLIKAAMFVEREGGTPDYCFLNPIDFGNLINTLGAKSFPIQPVQIKVNEPHVTMGYEGVRIIATRKGITCISDPNCPQGVANLLQMNTWELKSLGPVASIFDGDSLTLIRDANADNLLLRCVSYAQISCRAPGYNCRVLLPSSAF